MVEARQQIEADRKRLAALGPRSLTNEQAQNLINELARAQGGRIEIVQLGDQDASDLAVQFITVFREARWRVSVTRIGVMAPPPYGLTLGAPETRETGIVIEAFADVQIPIEFRPRQAGEPMTLVVGLKPVR